MEQISEKSCELNNLYNLLIESDWSVLSDRSPVLDLSFTDKPSEALQFCRLSYASSSEGIGRLQQTHGWEHPRLRYQQSDNLDIHGLLHEIFQISDQFFCLVQYIIFRLLTSSKNPPTYGATVQMRNHSYPW